MNQEQSIRLKILDSLLQSPHRKIEEVVSVHKDMATQDPLFYAHLAVWAMEHTEIRDHKEVFVASLLLSEYPEHREAGYMLLQDLPPYQVERIKNHVKRVFKKNPPRIMKTAVKNYLRAIEANVNRFDGAAASKQRKALTGLYASFQVKPNERAQATLFDNNPPADSKVAQVKALAATTDPTEQAKLIVEKNISYTTAVGAVEHLTPTVLAALINQMSAQELLVNVGSLKKRGALNSPELKALIEAKLEQVKKSNKVDALKAQKAAEVLGDEEISAQLKEISDIKVKELGRITRSTALLIDKSSSMDQAIELGKQIGSLISAVMNAPFYCWAFDDMAVQIKCQSSLLDDWIKAFKMIKAGSSTSCGVGITQLVRNKQSVEQIIMVSDQGENRQPYFANAMDLYRDTFGSYPRVVFVNCGPSRVDQLERACKTKNIEYDVFNIPKSADYYSLPNLIPLLSKPGRLDLLDEIMNTPLPQRNTQTV